MSAALPRVFGVLMTRNEADLLRVNLVHHLSSHCERVIVVDNGSTDATPKILKRLAKHHAISWTTEAGALHQSETVNALAQDARKAGAEWVLPLDTDEFWHAARPLPQLLAEQSDAGAVEAPRIEFIQARDQSRATSQSVLRMTMRVETPLLGAGPRDEFVAGNRSMFEVAPDPKVVVRMTPDVHIPRGAHRAERLPGPSVVSSQLVVFHAPLRARAALEKRVEHGRRIADVESDPTVSYQNRYWQRLGDEGLLDDGWRAHSWADGALDVSGRPVELVEDRRLAEILAPIVRTRGRQLLARVTGRAW